MLSYRILGPVDVLRDGRRLPLGSTKQRALLVCLLVRRGQTVPIGRLLEDLWADDAPASAEHQVHVYVSRLRKILAADGRQPLVTRSPGYLLEVAGDDEVDSATFEARVREARADLDERPERAAATLANALAAWRGPALADLVDEPFARAVATRLEEMRTVAEEDRVAALLAVGRQAEAIPELEALVADHPLRERLRELQMLALYRSGRQADALTAFDSARRTLAEQLGVDPGPGLRSLETAILRHDERLTEPARRIPHPSTDQGTPGRAAPRGTSRTVEERRALPRSRAGSTVLAGLVAGAVAIAAVWAIVRTPTPAARTIGRDRIGRSSPRPGGDRLTWASVPAFDETTAGVREIVLAASTTPSGYLACGTRREPAEGHGFDYDLAVWTTTRPTAGWSSIAGLHQPGNQRATDVAVLARRIVFVGWDSSPGAFRPAVWVAPLDGGRVHRVGQRSPVLSLSTSRAHQGRIRGLTVAGERLFAVGSTQGRLGRDAAVWTSDDGLEWVAATSGGMSGPADTELLDVAQAGRRVVAVGYATAGGLQRAAAWDSANGLTWDRSRVPSAPRSHEQQMTAVAAGGGGAVAVGFDTRDGDTDGAAWFSEDTIHWHHVSDPSLGGDGEQRMFGVTWSSNNGFVAVGEQQGAAGRDAVVWTSPDGRTWRRQPPNTGTTPLMGPGTQIATSLLPLPFGLLAFGAEGTHTSQAAHAWVGRWSAS